MINQSRLRFSKPVKSVGKHKYMKKIMKTHSEKILMSKISNKIKCFYTRVIPGSKHLRLKSNKRIKTINGNIRNNTIDILNWNKG